MSEGDAPGADEEEVKKKHVVSAKFSRALVSFTFDGFPASAVRIGARVLESFDVRGTFYACAQYSGENSPLGHMYGRADLEKLQEEGHEIGCQTASDLSPRKKKSEDFAADLEANLEGLRRLGVRSEPSTFAHPYDETHKVTRYPLPDRFVAGRGLAPELNIGRCDLHMLGAFPLYGRDFERRCIAALDKAAKRNAWVIFYTHDVSARPSVFGTQTQLLEKMIHRALRLNVEVLPVATVAQRLALAVA